MSETSIGFLRVGTLAKVMILSLGRRWPELGILLSQCFDLAGLSAADRS